MQNMGRGQFNYEVFQAAYDADPALQELVKDFNPKRIELKNSEVDDLETGTAPKGGGDSINTMAKRAVDFDDL